ncbi:MAG: TraX family protein [Peptococcia bacterium]|jgi:hypothetical protein
METVMGKTKLLSGFMLKWIAIIGMVVDHFGSIIIDGVLSPYVVNGSIYFTADMPYFIFHAFTIKNICGIFGDIAFPLFFFLVAEGFLKTRNRLKYGTRVGIFALISEIPYNLAHYQTIFEPKLQNVLVTLSIAIFTLILISKIEEKYQDHKTVRWVYVILSTITGMGVAFLLRGEYVFLGVLAIVLFYLLRSNEYLRLCGLCPFLIVSPWVLLSLIPITMYNGQRGKGPKYFFYIFYPAHLLLFALIAQILSNRII